ncbi:isoprenylcysteine carboxylmethyltransferase family protein [Actinomadura luteofluorescens]|uniref:isoprenylcysteine carboxyl methyltransferase family protein n=1 Tax=Actinomadura luteofluorescens TaxID=46163 RepID=UPI00216408F0|nr:isoprenylcysteine carboxylmethyltransferase family protein [Actinomadura glauciflava]MCR3742312.1 alkylresorcinol O-methyltransferase [Actinomadura glauciflava]
MTGFTLLIALVGAERIAELIVARRNQAWARSRGGVEYGRGHYPGIVAAQVGLLGGALLEARLLDRPFVPILGWSMLALAVLAQGLRWWCIATLGRRWNTRVIIVPHLPLVDRGPYRRLRHPNYVAVVVEGIALPLVHTCWITALLFTVVNLGLLRVRIRTENIALNHAAGTTPA